MTWGPDLVRAVDGAAFDAAMAAVSLGVPDWHGVPGQGVQRGE
jgi:hypothetical protein